MKTKVNDFLNEFGTVVSECDEDVELMMDDHICIEWEGIEYYVAENNSFYTDANYDVVSYLNKNHHV